MDPKEAWKKTIDRAIAAGLTPDDAYAFAKARAERDGKPVFPKEDAAPAPKPGGFSGMGEVRAADTPAAVQQGADTGKWATGVGAEALERKTHERITGELDNKMAAAKEKNVYTLGEAMSRMFGGGSNEEADIAGQQMAEQTRYLGKLQGGTGERKGGALADAQARARAAAAAPPGTDSPQVK